MVYSVQVKRLRHEDPLQALVLSGAKRKRRDADDGLSAESDFVFRLAHTLNAQQPGNDVVLESAPRSAQDTERKVHIVGSKRVKKNDTGVKKVEKTADEDAIPPELHDMLAEYIQPQKKDLGLESEGLDKETEDYVYDVYFSEQAGLPAETQVGYIDVNETEERLLFGESDSEDGLALEDDDDSNAEDYYRNDYPEEEDLSSDSNASSLFEQAEADESLRVDEWSEDETDPAEAAYSRYGWG